MALTCLVFVAAVIGIPSTKQRLAYGSGTLVMRPVAMTTGAHMRQIPWLSACAVLFLLSLGPEARAQSFRGGLRGAVKASDRIIPGVTVTLVDEATGISRETVRNERGEYAIAAVTPGSYAVRATLDGFKATTAQGGLR